MRNEAHKRWQMTGRFLQLERVELPQCWAWVGVPRSDSSCLMASWEGWSEKESRGDPEGSVPCLLAVLRLARDKVGRQWMFVMGGVGRVGGASGQVDYLNIAPLLLQILSYQPTVAMTGLFLAAQQAPVGHGRSYIHVGYATFLHEGQELMLIHLPVTMAFAVTVQHLFRGGKFRQMDIFHSADFFQEILQVVLLGEACQLGDVAQSHVNYATGTGPPQQLKEGGGRLLGESDGVEFQNAPLGTYPEGCFAPT